MWCITDVVREVAAEAQRGGEAHSISGSMKRLIMIHLFTLFSAIIGIEKECCLGW